MDPKRTLIDEVLTMYVDVEAQPSKAMEFTDDTHFRSEIAGENPDYLRSLLTRWVPKKDVDSMANKLKGTCTDNDANT